MDGIDARAKAGFSWHKVTSLLHNVAGGCLHQLSDTLSRQSCVYPRHISQRLSVAAVSRECRNCDSPMHLDGAWVCFLPFPTRWYYDRGLYAQAMVHLVRTSSFLCLLRATWPTKLYLLLQDSTSVCYVVPYLAQCPSLHNTKHNDPDVSPLRPYCLPARTGKLTPLKAAADITFQFCFQ
jgi:hypothetical protein